MSQLINDVDRIYKFMAERGVDLMYSAGMQGIANERDGKIVGGVLYDAYNGSNVWMHVAGTEGINWVTKSLLRASFAYPFVQLKCQRITGWVEASNEQARRFDEHVGFKQEAVLERAAKDGGDVIIYRMFRHECRFI